MRLFDFRFTWIALLLSPCAWDGPRAQTAPHPDAPAAKPGLEFHGGAAFSMGRLVHSSDTAQLNYSGNPIQNVSAYFSAAARFRGDLLVSAGLGIVERHYLPGRISDIGGRTPFIMTPVILDASATYSLWENEGSGLSFTAGYFPYRYNPDAKDLGLYLLRGPVYPGVLVSGYDSKYTQPVANTMGLRARYVSGPLEQNLILGSEIENYPLFDFSPAYIANLALGKALRIGAGVNLYHFIPIERKLTSPDTVIRGDLPVPFNGDPNSRNQIYVDTVTHDTTFLSFAGTKVMAYASFDPKAFFPSEMLGAEDLRLYAEIAVIGLDRSKAYDAVYGNLTRRMPVMVGFNWPTFGMLDHLSLEVEWYGSRVKDDLGRLQSTTGNFQSPLPVVNSSGLDLGRDNWKWCLQAAKNVGHLQFMLQAANDHTRPGGTWISPGSEWQAYFATPKDWYWLAKLGFAF